MTFKDKHALEKAAAETLDKMAAQVRTLAQQRDAAQDNIKTLAAQLLDAQKQLDLAYKQSTIPPLLAPPPAHPPPTQRLADRSQGAGRHEVWRPSAERDAASSNPELAALLKRIAINNEVAVAISNKNLAADNYMLHAWCTWMQKAGVKNHMVVALDEFTKGQAAKFGSEAVMVTLSGETEQAALKQGSNHAVSGLKFQILQEFLLLGYSVLLSDVDILTVQNPFDFLVRDADIEGMSDGWDQAKAYGYNDVFDSPEMGWSRYSHSMRVSVINSGLFYMQPTQASLDVLRLVFERIEKEHGWDQALFNEVIFFPSRPGYVSPCPTRRIMDRYLFMNSKTLFVYLRKDKAQLSRVVPAMLHLNYHNDKFRRLRAAEDFYLNHNVTALDPFSDASR